MLPGPIALLLGGLLVVASIKFLFYALDCGGKLLCLAFFGGFPFFFLGFALIFFCFLPDPPSIFGLGIARFHF